MIDYQNLDNSMVDFMAKEMKYRLALARIYEDKSGWNDPEVCSYDVLCQSLLANMRSGDFVSVANYAAMLQYRKRYKIDHE